MAYGESARVQAGGQGWQLFVPKLYTVLWREGYGLAALRADAIAGLTVAIVALPLAMALAIASGTTPDKGLTTVIVAGFLISALGGSRFQIGGPTGAFVVIVFGVIARQGYDGLLVATLIAGLILVVAGLCRLGTVIKYVPQPVVTGFTAGIAVIIFSSQLKDIFGLPIDKVPAEFVAKLGALWAHRAGFDATTFLLAAGSLAVIIVLRRLAPRLPGFLIAVVGGAVVVWLLGLQTDTIGSRFGGIPSALPTPALPVVSWARIVELLPDAFTIAFLAGVESLLSAVVADGMTGRRHRSNCELVAQGVANCASALFGGLPATGAIARTATNIRSGARSPVSGMLHAVFVLAFMAALAPLAVYIPLASLAAVLVMVAWNMSEIERFRHLLKGPSGDAAVLVLTFVLTVLVDLTVGIAVGVVLASVLFVRRMALAVEIVAVAAAEGNDDAVGLIEEDINDFARPATDRYTTRMELPPGVEIYEIRGPFFFGVAARLGEVLDRIAGPPRVFILGMHNVPLIDASGATALQEFMARCRRHDTALILAGVRPQLRSMLGRMGIAEGGVTFAETRDAALALAGRLATGKAEAGGAAARSMA